MIFIGIVILIIITYHPWHYSIYFYYTRTYTASFLVFPTVVGGFVFLLLGFRCCILFFIMVAVAVFVEENTATTSASTVEVNGDNDNDGGGEEVGEDEMGLHFDSDNKLEEQTGNILLHPRIST